MRPIYILKIGGSIVTYKDRPGFSVRRLLLRKIAKAIKSAMEEADLDLILVHGAGALGHRLAKKYDLKNGVCGDEKKLHGAILTRNADQKLNNAIVEIFTVEGIAVTPVHTASIIMQKNGKMDFFEMKLIREALKQKCVPVLYGDMVFDSSLGMSVCSGDVIVPCIAEKIKVQKIFFASDVDGVCTKDPHVFKNAKLVEEIRFDEIHKKTELTGSHNVDVTGGFLGKIQTFEKLRKTPIEAVEIFNGLNAKNYKNVLTGKKFPHTTVHIK